MELNRRLFACLGVVSLAACATGSGSEEDAAAKRTEIDTKASTALDALYTEDSNAKALAAEAKGILVFPDVIKGGLFGFTGEGGTGVLQKEGASAGYYSLAGGGIGLALGIQSYSQVLLFMTDEALAEFESGVGWEAGVDGSVAVLDMGASGDIDTSNIQEPIIGFIFGESGLMASATIEGTKYTKLDL